VVNARVVNAAIAYFSPATFCESFRVFGLIPRFQNPFKYICRSRINRKTAHVPVQPPIQRQTLARRINSLAGVNTPEKRTAYNGALKDRPRGCAKWAGPGSE
jgi:hypothetical protein